MKYKSLLALINNAEMMINNVKPNKLLKKKKPCALNKEIAMARMTTALIGNGITYSHLGILLTEKGDLRGAERAFRDAIRAEPEYYMARLLLGANLYGRGKYSAAVTEYRSAIDFLGAKYALSHGALAEALEKQGKIDSAIKHYKIAADFGHKSSKMRLDTLAKGESK